MAILKRVRLDGGTLRIVDNGPDSRVRYQLCLTYGPFTRQFPTTEPVGLDELYSIAKGLKTAKGLERRIDRYN